MLQFYTVIAEIYHLVSGFYDTAGIHEKSKTLQNWYYNNLSILYFMTV